MVRSLDDELTLCTVTFRSKAVFKRNQMLTQLLNPGCSPSWLVIDNSPSYDGESTAPEPGLSVVPGPQRCRQPDLLERSLSGSLAHGLALNQAISLVPTRFVMIVDPDFFVVRPNWLTDLQRFMLSTGTAIFGAPWNPRWWSKWRGFPCTHFLLLDLERLRHYEFDFRPAVSAALDEAMSETTNARANFYRMAARAFCAIARNAKARNDIGGSQDTGYRLHRDLAGCSEVTVECLLPVYSPSTDYSSRRPFFINRLLDPLFPDENSYRPKDVTSYTAAGFAAHGYPSTHPFGGEEFMWHGAPFGFHLRGQQNSHDPNQQLDALDHVVPIFAELAASFQPSAGGAHGSEAMEAGVSNPNSSREKM